MYIVFFSTSDVFKAEEKLKEKSIYCEIVPTPVTDKAYCGVCLMVDDKLIDNLLIGIDYKIVEEKNKNVF